MALLPPFLGPGFRLGARWSRRVEAVKTRKKRKRGRWATKAFVGRLGCAGHGPAQAVLIYRYDSFPFEPRIAPWRLLLGSPLLIHGLQTVPPFQSLRSRHGLQWSLKVAGSTAAASHPLLSVLTVWTIVVLVAMPGHTPGWLGQGKPAGMPSPRTLCQESATAL